MKKFMFILLLFLILGSFLYSQCQTSNLTNCNNKNCACGCCCKCCIIEKN
ncbi:MAG: hypothetical protein N2589_04855 [bacterium]|nr:hypothetical protein [bacterium]MCX7917438.1 hypothetical protein [bacterium]MDW8163759.1 hypothetical protein [Candidatus Omnitrophota bacterium]